MKGHSLIFDTGANIPAEAAFLEYTERSGARLAPELFPRTDGTTYVCAISSEEPLPADPARVVPDPGAIEWLEAMCRTMSPVVASAKILARQACYRPLTRDGLALIGPVSGAAGAYIATGHSVWGILDAPATGEAMAELIVDGTAHAVDLAPFDPGRVSIRHGYAWAPKLLDGIMSASCSSRRANSVEVEARGADLSDSVFIREAPKSSHYSQL